MSLTRTLTTAMAILALGAITASCAGANVGLSFGPNRPMMQTAVPAEEPDEVEVAGVSSRGAVRDNEPWLHRKPARVIKRPVGVTAPHFRCNARTGLPENPGNAWCGDLRR